MSKTRDTLKPWCPLLWGLKLSVSTLRGTVYSSFPALVRSSPFLSKIIACFRLFFSHIRNTVMYNNHAVLKQIIMQTAKAEVIE